MAEIRKEGIGSRAIDTSIRSGVRFIFRWALKKFDLTAKLKAYGLDPTKIPGSETGAHAFLDAVGDYADDIKNEHLASLANAVVEQTRRLLEVMGRDGTAMSDGDGETEQPSRPEQVAQSVELARDTLMIELLTAGDSELMEKTFAFISGVPTRAGQERLIQHLSGLNEEALKKFIGVDEKEKAFLSFLQIDTEEEKEDDSNEKEPKESWLDSDAVVQKTESWLEKAKKDLKEQW